jgi:predicted DsbA family dithiol-disulfide isomerase
LRQFGFGSHRSAQKRGIEHLKGDACRRDTDAAEFPDLVRRYNVNGVPKTVINDSLELMGAAPEEDFMAALAQSTGE